MSKKNKNNNEIRKEDIKPLDDVKIENGSLKLPKPITLEIPGDTPIRIPTIASIFLQNIIPEITNGVIKAKDYYYDPKKQKTVVEFIVHLDNEYEVSIEVKHTSEDRNYKITVHNMSSDKKHILSYKMEEA